MPADLRTTVPAHDMRWCLLKRETRRTRLAGLRMLARRLFFQSSGHVQHRLGRETFLVPGTLGFETDTACGARRPLAQCLRMLARRVFAWKHARPRRSNATATVYCCRHERERLATRTRRQPWMWRLPHIAKIFQGWTIQSTFSRLLPYQLLPAPLTDTKIGCQTNNVRKMAGIGRRDEHCVCNEVHWTGSLTPAAIRTRSLFNDVAGSSYEPFGGTSLSLGPKDETTFACL